MKPILVITLDILDIEYFNHVEEKLKKSGITQDYHCLICHKEVDTPEFQLLSVENIKLTEEETEKLLKQIISNES